MYDRWGKLYECIVCGNEKTETIAKTGHIYNDGEITKEATCVSEGMRTYTCKTCGHEKMETIKKTPHTYDSGTITLEPTCRTTGLKTYECIMCGEKKKKTIDKIPHSYKLETVKATVNKNGRVEKKCGMCGMVVSKNEIYYPKTITLSKTSFVYSGKVQKPKISILGSDGKKISTSNYVISYSNGCKNVGSYAVKITFKGNYVGALTKTYAIIPNGVTIQKISAISKGFVIKWKKQSLQTTGYQIQYSTSKQFTNAKTVTVPKNSIVSKRVIKLIPKKTYYVRIRTYKKTNSKSYYSTWSTPKAVTTKK